MLKNKVKIIFLIFLIVSIAFLSLPLNIAEKVRGALIDWFYPVLKGISFLSDKVYHLKEWAANLSSSAEENIILRRQLHELYRKVVSYQELGMENAKLRALLKLKDSLNYETISARVIGRDLEDWFDSLVIDKGSKDGIKVDSPVISEEGVVGRIISVGKYSSRVMLLTDINSRVGVLIQETRTPGILEGRRGDGCVLTFIDKTTEIKPGMNVITSGYGMIFPKGLFVGKVNEVELVSDLYKQAKVKLGVDINRIEYVLVVIRNFQE